MKNPETYVVKGKKSRRSKKRLKMEQEKKLMLDIQPVVRDKIQAIISGQDILKLTYDRVFRAIFHPDIHRDRLERFLSQLMGRKVKIVKSVPIEGNDRTVDAKRIYMDILVEFEDGSLANVEMQRVGKLFPNKRAAVYSSDLIVRQYAVAKNKIKEQ